MNVFISYKQKVDPDHDLAASIERELKKRSHYVFRDVSSIDAGEKWASRIQEELKACEVMVCLISNNSLKSRWVVNEIDFAQDLSTPIIPVLLEELDEDLKFQVFNPRFGDIKFYRVTGDDAADIDWIGNRIDRMASKSGLDNPIESPVEEERKDADPEQTAWTALSDEARTMLVEVSKDDHGTLIDASHMGGTEFLTGGKNLIPDQSPRTIARWKSALRQLETNELIEEPGEDVFKITSKGFDAAGNIKKAEDRRRAMDAVPREKINQQETADDLRSTIIWAEEDWTTEKESGPKNADYGRLIIQRLGESLHDFRVACRIPEHIGRFFDNVIREVKQFQRHGGKSATFWRMGDHIIEKAKTLGIDVALAFAADADPSYSGTCRGYSAEELKGVLVQFLKRRESEAFANLRSLDPPSGSFMAGELIHFRQLDEKLDVPPGTSRTLLREAAREFNLKIKKATSNTIQFE